MTSNTHASISSVSRFRFPLNQRFPIQAVIIAFLELNNLSKKGSFTVNDGIWPHKNATTLDQQEAERRVFYVGFTRAKKRVVMLVSKSLGGKAASPSPYISELGLSL